ncbi:hypothetical protein Taro_010002 [Colocasia esculenta]|uniref:CRM-domain containing factor CFM3, chloroplastic/mitochondrial n=1 Tax=Colocasia esculenta TaxID=4460 RepID=A0A843U6H3_COLES|nr:hypothetical protein [Colocasia esculenta]
MALSTAKISELPFHIRTRTCAAPLRTIPSLPLDLLRSRFRRLFTPSASFRVAERGSAGGGDLDARRNAEPRTRQYPWDEDYSDAPDAGGPRRTGPPRAPPSAPWLQKWTEPSPSSAVELQQPVERRRRRQERMEGEGKGRGGVGYLDKSDGGRGSIERIVYRLRNLGLDKEEDEEDSDIELDEDMRLGDLLERSWNRPDSVALGEDTTVLPWERGDVDGDEYTGEDSRLKRKRVRAPTMAELTIEDTELRRLRRLGIASRERITIPKAGVTQAVLEKIHGAWRKSELVRLKFHETLAHDMKTAHEIVERRTGGLVIWRSGSVMVVYRGSSYKWSERSKFVDGENNPMKVSHGIDSLIVPDVSSSTKSSVVNDKSLVSLTSEMSEQSCIDNDHVENMTEEEQEYNLLLDDLGPRFLDWWGTGLLPVDADLLPQHIPGYRPPFRLLPTGMRSRLTNAEMTNLRKLARKLPSHFALGRNRNHHGLAAAIVKLWEKSLVVKIAVKRGIQNTNNKLMAEELKVECTHALFEQRFVTPFPMLTGGILLLRNKYYIVIYRGKDFLPPCVAAALAEQEELAKDIQDLEEKVRRKDFVRTSDATGTKSEEDLKEDIQDDKGSLPGETHRENVNGKSQAGTFAEFQEAQSRWGREISAEQQQRMREEASRIQNAKIFKRLEHKLSLAQSKKLRAERLLAKIESSMVPIRPSDDVETITDEERSVFRRIGLRMKAYLPLGIRGVFDGVIENMHLHWKHRELVKLISKQKTLLFVEDTARLLEYESGGILVAIERVPKGYALIYYRGKNYQRPISLRPRNLLTKAKALKRSVAMQRHEALCQHITELEKSIELIKSELGDCKDVDFGNHENTNQTDHGHASDFSENVGDDSFLESEYDDDLDNFGGE